MATLVLFDQFGYDLGRGSHVLGGAGVHTFKIALVAQANAPVQSTSAVFGDLTQIGGGTGYTTGGVALTTPTWTEPTEGTWKFSTDDLTLTGSGGGMGPFRYVVLFNDTTASPVKPLIGYLDYGSDITVTAGNTFFIDVGTSGWFQIPIT